MTTNSAGTWTVEWFGTTTFRVRRPGLDLFFDGYLDRLTGLAPVGLTTAEVDRADFISVTGGETVDCGLGATVRVLPALHSCLFANADSDSAVACLGDLGVSAQERWRQIQAVLDGGFDWAPPPLVQAMREMLGHSSRHDGGQLAFQLRTSDGSALFSGSSGYWPGIFAGLQPDVAFLALAGRPNVSGEPYQGPAARFILEQAETLRPGRVCFCHHDPLLPGLPGTDVTEAVALIEARKPGSHFALDYAAARPLFA